MVGNTIYQIFNGKELIWEGTSSQFKTQNNTTNSLWTYASSGNLLYHKYKVRFKNRGNDTLWWQIENLKKYGNTLCMRDLDDTVEALRKAGIKVSVRECHDDKTNTTHRKKKGVYWILEATDGYC